MPTFGKRSKEKLVTCHKKLQLICWEAIAIMDFSILEGYRNAETQDKLFKDGKSKLEYPDSKHNKYLSLAVDIAPYPIAWEDRQSFYALAGIMFTIAHSKGIKLRWGGTWGGLQDKNKSGFVDLPHFELVDY